MADLAELESRAGHRFHDPALLRLALTHPSIAHEAATRLDNNQRLEFLGDAVLGLVLTRSLYDKFPSLDEGVLTKARAQLVNTRSLAAQARKLDLGGFLIVSRGEEASGGRKRDGALADAYEALIGAIYLDGGFEPAREFVLREFKEEYGEFEALPNLHNPKGELQELVQAASTEPIVYRVESVTGPDHARSFEVSVSHGGTELGRGAAGNKKDAEILAAQAALDALRHRLADAARGEKKSAPE